MLFEGPNRLLDPPPPGMQGGTFNDRDGGLLPALRVGFALLKGYTCPAISDERDCLSVKGCRNSPTSIL